MRGAADAFFAPLADGLEAWSQQQGPDLGLGEFAREAWHVVEPATEYVHGWHLDAIDEHLEAVTVGELQRLVINIPPRCSKSLRVSVFWPAWTWTFAPSVRFLFSSYAQQLATRDSLKCRRVVTSAWYRREWGHVFDLTTDQNVKTRFENDRTGYRLSTSVRGSSTGEGGDVIVADDPHNVSEADSDLRRENTVTWWDEVMSTRLNDPERGARVLIMQRIHERDLTAHVLEHAGWDHLMLPMEYDPRRHCATSLGWEDPREEEGELLWPERFPRDRVDELTVELGPYGAASQLQQDPISRSGGTFRRDWFDRTTEVPGGLWYFGYVDKAGTREGGKLSVIGLLGMDLLTGHVWIVDMEDGRWEMAEREGRIDEAAARWERLLGSRSAFKLWVEQEPGSGGKDSARLTVQRLTRKGYLADVDVAVANKFSRADHFAGAAKAGMVHVLEDEWTDRLLRYLEAAGPGAADLGHMDVCSGAYNRLLETREERMPAGEEEEVFGFDEGGFYT